MKILTDLGHPKNVYVLKNLVPLLKKKGHEFHFVYRDKEHTKQLCKTFGFAGLDRGKGGTGILGKSVYLLKTDFRLYQLARKIKPDLLLSFASPYLASLARLIKKPMIVFDDTEQNRLVQKMYAPVAAAIVVPDCFGKTLSQSQFNFNGYYELAYLCPRYFQPDPSIFSALRAAPRKKFVLLRFVSWKAVHDINRRGLGDDQKQKLAAAFSGLARIFISSEGPLPKELEPLRLNVSPQLIHQVMTRASLVFSEGATMAAEAAVLGIPTIYCSDLKPGYIKELEQKHGLLSAFSRIGFQAAMARGMEILQDEGVYKQALLKKRDKMLEQSIDVVEFMAWFIDRFPESVKVLSKEPGYVDRFRGKGNG